MKKIFAILVIALFIGSSISIGNAGDKSNAKYFEECKKMEARVMTCEPKFSRLLQPTVVIDSPEDGTTLHTRNVTVHGYAYASSEECKLTYWEFVWEWNGGSMSNSSYISPPADTVEFWIRIHGLALGANNITVTFLDTCELSASDKITIYYEDIYPPHAEIVSPKDGSVFEEPNIEVIVNADDGYGTPQWGSGVRKISWTHRWDGGEEKGNHTFDKPYDIITSFTIPMTLRAGENVIEVTATDEAGNVGYPDTITVTYLANEPPVVSIDYPKSGNIYKNAIYINGVAIDDTTMVYRMGYTHKWEGGETGNEWEVNAPYYAFHIPVSLKEGRNEIRVYAYDDYGVIGEDSITLVYINDTTPPSVEKIKPTNGVYINDRKVMPFFMPVIIGKITVEAVASDDSGIERVEFYVDGMLKYWDYSPPYIWECNEKLLMGHKIKVVAYDNAGNSAAEEENTLILNKAGKTMQDEVNGYKNEIQEWKNRIQQMDLPQQIKDRLIEDINQVITLIEMEKIAEAIDRLFKFGDPVGEEGSFIGEVLGMIGEEISIAQALQIIYSIPFPPPSILPPGIVFPPPPQKPQTCQPDIDVIATFTYSPPCFNYEKEITGDVFQKFRGDVVVGRGTIVTFDATAKGCSNCKWKWEFTLEGITNHYGWMWTRKGGTSRASVLSQQPGTMHIKVILQCQDKGCEKKVTKEFSVTWE